MRIVYHDLQRVPKSVEAEFDATYMTLEGLLAESDFVSLHTVLSPETKGLINAERLGWMKPTAVLVNTSRGPVVDSMALVDALRDGTIAGGRARCHRPRAAARGPPARRPRQLPGRAPHRLGLARDPRQDGLDGRREPARRDPRRPPPDPGQPRGLRLARRRPASARAIKRSAGASGDDSGMNPQPDTFLAFIDDLAADLDDHESSAEDRAGRHFLSRSHFDRVISATAGEPPAAFRRRILLERAAYQLATTSDGILRLAVDAGYSSNEAFTRAFQRAYGVAPSAWRARPQQIQLAAPNDVHFHPPGGIRLPATSEETTMNLLVRMVEHHLWLVGEMVDRAATLGRCDPRSADRAVGRAARPGATTRRLLSRLVGQMDMWQNVIAGRGYDMAIEAHEAVADLRARLDVAGPGVPGRGPPRRRGRATRRDVHRCLRLEARGLHLRRAHRPRADVRCASPAARPRGPRVRRHHGPRERRPAPLGRRRSLGAAAPGGLARPRRSIPGQPDRHDHQQDEERHAGERGVEQVEEQTASCEPGLVARARPAKNAVTEAGPTCVLPKT